MSKPTTTRHYLRIGQIAKRSGVSIKALRLYAERGLLKPCTHSEAGYRLYGPEALRRLMQIVVLKRSGFTLAQID
ncbi:MAG TPA: MerR family transcriptional regulator, partial [Xanthomonadaceae bacterium]|nr:MerR family transcriptional regulator [Xanthomonadaceae bacterium]